MTSGDDENTSSLISSVAGITDNEDKGVKEILEYYGGQCEYSIGFENDIDYFELKMTKSVALEDYQDQNMIVMPGSNIPYLFYSNLLEEREVYDEIRCIIVLENGKEFEFQYSREDLEIVYQSMKVVDKIVDYLKDGNFNSIKSMINDKGIIDYDKNELIDNMKSLESRFGTAKTFLSYGFILTNNGKDQNTLRISGQVEREIESHQFSVYIDLKAPKGEVYLIEYKF